MTRDEAVRLAGIMHAAFTERERGWTAEEILGLAAQPGVVVVGDPSGFGIMRVAGTEAEILTLAVLPAQRRRGVGRALLDRLLATARMAGCTRVVLEVGETNAALELYHSAGFVHVGRRPGYSRLADGRREDALILSRTLA